MPTVFISRPSGGRWPLRRGSSFRLGVNSGIVSVSATPDPGMMKWKKRSKRWVRLLKKGLTGPGRRPGRRDRVGERVGILSSVGASSQNENFTAVLMALRFSDALINKPLPSHLSAKIRQKFAF